MLSFAKYVIPLALLATAGLSSASTICTESDSGPTLGDSADGLQEGGCVQSITVNTVNGAPFTFTVASDGEVSFDPFGFDDDTSDGIKLGAGWALGFNTIGWEPVPDQEGTWVLPGDLSSIGCGSENTTTCEPIGEFQNTSLLWDLGGASQLEFDILDPDGSVGDQIFVDNNANAPGGGAQITFHSDADIVIPEPSAIVMIGFGLLAIALRAIPRKAV